MTTTTARLASMAAALAWLTVGVAHAQAAPAPAGPVADQHHARTKHHHRAAVRMHPPTHPVQPTGAQASATSPAPVPNESVAAPNDAGAQGANVAPSVFQLHYPPQGDGYVTGSSPQAMDDRNAAKATGVQMKVPLPQ